MNRPSVGDVVRLKASCDANRQRRRSEMVSILRVVTSDTFPSGGRKSSGSWVEEPRRHLHPQQGYGGRRKSSGSWVEEPEDLRPPLGMFQIRPREVYQDEHRPYPMGSEVARKERTAPIPFLKLGWM